MDEIKESEMGWDWVEKGGKAALEADKDKYEGKKNVHYFKMSGRWEGSIEYCRGS